MKLTDIGYINTGVNMSKTYTSAAILFEKLGAEKGQLIMLLEYRRKIREPFKTVP